MLYNVRGCDPIPLYKLIILYDGDGEPLSDFGLNSVSENFSWAGQKTKDWSQKMLILYIFSLKFLLPGTKPWENHLSLSGVKFSRPVLLTKVNHACKSPIKVMKWGGVEEYKSLKSKGPALEPRDGRKNRTYYFLWSSLG